MRSIDSLKPFVRALIHEYGIVIVAKIWNSGTIKEKAMRAQLETWRERKQTELLGSDYIEDHGRIQCLANKHSVSAAYVRALTRRATPSSTR